MNWIGEIFKAIGEFFGWKKQVDNPEYIRLRKLRQLDDELKKVESTRDKLLTEKITDENRESQAIELGIVIDELVRLRIERSLVERQR